MKILFFTMCMSSGGAERVTANLSNYWVARGNSVTVVTMGSKSSDFYELDPRIERVYLNLLIDSANPVVAIFRNFVRIRALRKVLVDVQPDIAIGMLTNSNTILALASLGLKSIFTIGSERTYPPVYPINFFWNTLRRYSYGLLSAVTAMSSEGKNWIEKNTGAKSVFVIPNSVTWPLPKSEPRLLPPKTQQRVLLTVGRLVREKGFNMLIEAFSMIANKHPDWDLIIVGEGDLRQIHEAQINELGLKDRIHLPGRAGNVGEWYENSDLYVLSSIVEGFPNTLAEAMAYGLAAVSFDCDTGPRDIIRHEVDGLLVPPKDVSALAAGLDRLMNDDKLRMAFANKALETRQRFSMESISALWDKILRIKN